MQIFPQESVRWVNIQFDNISDNINFSETTLSNRTFKQYEFNRYFYKHVTFCEYLVFHEFQCNLYITLAKYLEQEGIANLLFLICLYIYSLLK